MGPFNRSFPGAGRPPTLRENCQIEGHTQEGQKKVLRSSAVSQQLITEDVGSVCRSCPSHLPLPPRLEQGPVDGGMEPPFQAQLGIWDGAERATFSRGPQRCSCSQREHCFEKKGSTAVFWQKQQTLRQGEEEQGADKFPDSPSGAPRPQAEQTHTQRALIPCRSICALPRPRCSWRIYCLVIEAPPPVHPTEPALTPKPRWAALQAA